MQYLVTIFYNKNQKKLKNKAIKINLALVIATIVIPVLLIKLNIIVNIFVVPIFFILYLFFRGINNNVHKLYLEKEDKLMEQEIEGEKDVKNKVIKNIGYVLVLIVIGFLLFVISNLLGDSIENLCNTLKIPQLLIGILLGGITSIPELITFFESQKHHQKLNNQMLGVVEATNNLLTSNILNLFIIEALGILLLYF